MNLVALMIAAQLLSAPEIFLRGGDWVDRDAEGFRIKRVDDVCVMEAKLESPPATYLSIVHLSNGESQIVLSSKVWRFLRDREVIEVELTQNFEPKLAGRTARDTRRIQGLSRRWRDAGNGLTFAVHLPIERDLLTAMFANRRSLVIRKADAFLVDFRASAQTAYQKSIQCVEEMADTIASE